MFPEHSSQRNLREVSDTLTANPHSAPSNSTRKNILVGLTVFNAVVSVVDAVIIFPQCSPTDYNWDRSIPGGHCWPTEVIDGVGIIQGCTVISRLLTLASR